MTSQLHLPIVKNEDPQIVLDKLKLKVSGCTACALHKTRVAPVFGAGSINPDIMIIGEAPSGADELSGKPFSGSAKTKLLEIIKAKNLISKTFYLCHSVCCRPPQNRYPTIKEASSCSPFLQEQVKQVNPKLIVGLGSVAASRLWGKEIDIHLVRGKWTKFLGKPCITTHHPAALIQNILPEVKKALMKEFDQDFDKIQRFFERKPNESSV